jgi:hypothetical protein
MLRQATSTDIPLLTAGMLALKDHTQWRIIKGAYNSETLTQFLQQQLESATSVCYLWDDPLDGAFCGVSLGRMHLPPHLPYVFEWGWMGKPRTAAQCWRACTKWGKRHGAMLGCRTIAGIDNRHVTELVTWEVL